MASRGPMVGAARLFSSSQLDDMERRYQEMDEAAKRGEDISKMDVDESVQQTVTVPEAKDPRCAVPEAQIVEALCFGNVQKHDPNYRKPVNTVNIHDSRLLIAKYV